MEIIFLSEQTLEVKDHGYATDDFELILDALVPQKSSFVINNRVLNAELGDYLILRENNYFYIGIITEIEEQENLTKKIKTKDFLSLFDVKVPVSSYSGSISQFLLNLITNNFKYSGDSYQNLSYLTTQIDCTVSGSLTYEDDEEANILDLVEEFSKTYGIRLAYELVIQEGKFTAIKLKVVAVTRGVILRSDLGTITNLVLNDTNEDSINKVIFVPKKANTTYKSTINYFRLTDGSISTNVSSSLRFPKVNFKYQSYADKDYSSLLTKATSALVDSSLKHNITFDFSFVTNKVESLKEMTVGTYVQFIAPLKTYDTLVTQIKYKGTFKSAQITLGEYRVSLTDKLKLIDRRK